MTIDVLTRPGARPHGAQPVVRPGGPDELHAPDGITVNLLDGDPDVTTKLNVLAAAGTPPDGSWFPTGSDGAGGRERPSGGCSSPWTS